MLNLPVFINSSAVFNAIDRPRANASAFTSPSASPTVVAVSRIFIIVLSKGVLTFNKLALVVPNKLDAFAHDAFVVANKTQVS